MDSPCDAKELVNKLTTINPEATYDPYQYQQNIPKLFNGYQEDGTTVKEELSVSKSAIDIHGNASHTPGDLHMSNAVECAHLQYDLNNEPTKIKPEPLSDQSHPYISAFHETPSDGTAIETEATVSKLTVNTNKGNLFADDNIQRLKSEDLDHKDCSILMSVNEEYCDNMPVLDIKQENENVAHAIASTEFEMIPAASNCEMPDLTTEIHPPILDPLKINIKTNNPQLINHNNSRPNITTCW